MWRWLFDISRIALCGAVLTARHDLARFGAIWQIASRSEL